MEKDSVIYYAGIGSRETPKWCLQIFAYLGKRFALEGFILRSGHAKGADEYFELGCDEVGGNKEIYLPWKSFEFSTSSLIVRDPLAFEIGEKFHPYWARLSQGAQKLQARNSHQILGEDLKTPSKFVVCWTKNGTGSGGTGQAIRIAKEYGIPVVDFGIFSSRGAIGMDPYDYVMSVI